MDPASSRDEYEICVDRSGGKALGINVTVDYGTALMRIDRIEKQGLVADWNAAQSSMASKVDVGDLIVEANHTHGCVEKIHDQLEVYQRDMSIKLRRPHHLHLATMKELRVAQNKLRTTDDKMQAMHKALLASHEYQGHKIQLPWMGKNEVDAEASVLGRLLEVKRLLSAYVNSDKIPRNQVLNTLKACNRSLSEDSPGKLDPRANCDTTHQHGIEMAALRERAVYAETIAAETKEELVALMQRHGQSPDAEAELQHRLELEQELARARADASGLEEKIMQQGDEYEQKINELSAAHDHLLSEREEFIPELLAHRESADQQGAAHQLNAAELENLQKELDKATVYVDELKNNELRLVEEKAKLQKEIDDFKLQKEIDDLKAAQAAQELGSQSVLLPLQPAMGQPGQSEAWRQESTATTIGLDFNGMTQFNVVSSATSVGSAAQLHSPQVSEPGKASLSSSAKKALPLSPAQQTYIPLITEYDTASNLVQTKPPPLGTNYGRFLRSDMSASMQLRVGTASQPRTLSRPVILTGSPVHQSPSAQQRLSKTPTRTAVSVGSPYAGTRLTTSLLGGKPRTPVYGGQIVNSAPPLYATHSATHSGAGTPLTFSQLARRTPSLA